MSATPEMRRKIAAQNALATLDTDDSDVRLAVLDRLALAGLTFGDCVTFFSAQQDDKAGAYVSAAQEKWGDDVEVDANAIVSEGDDDGAYVMAWVWVSDEAAGLEKDVCERCGDNPVTDKESGLCSVCAANNDSRVVV